MNSAISSKDQGSEGYHSVPMIAFRVGSESGLPSNQLSGGLCHVGVANSVPPSFARHSRVTLLYQPPRKLTQVHGPSYGNMNTCLRITHFPVPQTQRASGCRPSCCGPGGILGWAAPLPAEPTMHASHPVVHATMLSTPTLWLLLLSCRGSNVHQQTQAHPLKKFSDPTLFPSPVMEVSGTCCSLLSNPLSWGS